MVGAGNDAWHSAGRASGQGYIQIVIPA